MGNSEDWPPWTRTHDLFAFAPSKQPSLVSAVTQQRRIVASYWKDTMWFCHRLFFIWLCCFNPPNTTSNNFYRHEIICTGNTVQSTTFQFHYCLLFAQAIMETRWRSLTTRQLGLLFLYEFTTRKYELLRHENVISHPEVVYTVYTTPPERGISNMDGR